MSKKIKSLRRNTALAPPSFLLFFSLLAIYTLLMIPFQAGIAAGQGVILLLLVIYFHNLNRKRERELLHYLDRITGNVDTPVQDNLEQSPLPVMVFRPETGDIMWSNQFFLKEVCGENGLTHTKINLLLPDFEARWILEGKSQCPTEQIVGDRRYLVFGTLVRTGEKGVATYLATTYWVEITELSLKSEELEASRTTISVIMIDNYEDLLRNLSESQSSAILSAVNGKLGDWVESTGGVIRRYARESYILLTERQAMDKLIEEKFDILDQVREVVSGKGIAATLSIGVGMGGESLDETFKFANLAIETALSRGGDQVVTKEQETFEFYGGRATETEKRSKVKSRVMANALSNLIADSSRVFIMGHKFPDMDAVGAAAGVFALARKKSVPAYIIRKGKESSAEDLYEKLGQLPEYHEKFITPHDALLLLDSRSLIVVVDTNRPDQVQAEELLTAENAKRIAVIDHHRRAASYIQDAVLNFHELYASSACELVTELLQYTLEPIDILRYESEALLAGIVLDTKNFTLRTGGRTFEAAAFLRRCGADTNEVKKLFQNDIDGAIARYKIVQSAQLFREDIAIAWTAESVGRVVAAQAADELLNIRGIATSFVVSANQEEALISGRSMGEINVQLVLEALGGGGNAAAAGAQIPEKTPEEALHILREALGNYLAQE
ncbi:MAG: DHH family phosphoesterase [Eubacteriales bacterium]